MYRTLHLLYQLSQCGESQLCMCCLSTVNVGIVFNNLGPNVDYTIRLRHEVGQQNTWFTDEAGPTFEQPGARVNPK